MKLCTENNIETVRLALMSLKLPIRRTVIKVPAMTTGCLKSGFPVCTKGAWLNETD